MRDKKTGKLVFKDHPEFTPNLTPKQVIQAGTWGGCYFHPRGGKQGIRGPQHNARGVSPGLVRGSEAGSIQVAQV